VAEASLTTVAPSLVFSVEDGAALEHAAVPMLRFALRLESDAPLRAAALNVQLRIAASRRRYTGEERERLVELFGRPEQWSRSLRSLHWANVSVQVPAFEHATVVELLVPCTYDLEVTASRYFASLEDGEVPLEFLFGGTVFYDDGDGRLQVRPIAWNEEAGYRLPVRAWRETMDRHFPGSAWVRLDRDAFERLHAYRARHALLTWERTVDALLDEAGEER
jgi:Family of unknown function (DUF6084)